MKQILTAIILVLCLVNGCAPSQSEDVAPSVPPTAQSGAGRITIDGIDFSHLSPPEVEKKLAAMEEKAVAKQINLAYGTNTWQVSLKDLGVTTNKQEIVDKLNSKNAGQDMDYRLEYKIDEQRAKAKIQSLTQALNTPAKDAVFQVKTENNTAQVIPHVVGKEVDVQGTLVNLQEGLAGQSTAIPVVVKEVPPQTKTEDLENIKFDTPLVTFATTFDPNDKNRTENLKQAAKALDGVAIKPGQVFSFNKTVGPRTEETGYKEALVIEENQLVPGVGGGVCQVSSTLYNLALLADLEIVERHHHEFAIRYLPPGRDATVVFDHADLRFKNNTPGMLLIRTESKGSSLKMTLYGKKSAKQVELQTKILDTKPFLTERRLDPKLPPGAVDKSKQGMPGYTVVTYRIVKINNKVVKQEELHKDTYKPATRIIRVGPATGRGEVP